MLMSRHGQVILLTCCHLAKPELEAMTEAVRGEVFGGCFSSSYCILCLLINQILLGVGSGKKLWTKSRTSALYRQLSQREFATYA